MPSTWNQLQELPPNSKLPFSLAGLLTIATAFLAVLPLGVIQPVVPLFYSLPTDQVLVSKYWLLIFPIFATFTMISHLFLIWFARQFQSIVLQLFTWFTLIVIGINFAILIRILWLLL